MKWTHGAVLLISLAVMPLAMMKTVVAQVGVPKGPHGAALESRQMERLERLGLDRTPVDQPPSGVVPEYWNSLIPADNRMTPERVALGKKLYFDARLSRDGTVSCATCHDVTRGFADQRATSEGIGGQLGKRNAPTTLNAVFLHSMFWDGRSPSLDHQAMQPIINPVEMGMENDESAIIAGIKDDPEYVRMFNEAYDRPVNFPDIGRALAAFERTHIMIDSPFRRYLAGQENAISENAKQGWMLFNTGGRCMSCHPMSPSSPVGSDSKFHNIGISAQLSNFDALTHDAMAALTADDSDESLDRLALSSDAGELGRFIVTRNVADIGAFRTPSLLNVGVTGPYMHDGSLETLWDVVDHYNKGGVPNRYLDGGIEPLNLTDRQMTQIVEFLFSLTDVRLAEQNRSEFTRQSNLAITRRERPHRDRKIADRSILSFEATASGVEKTAEKKAIDKSCVFENEESFSIDFVYPR